MGHLIIKLDNKAGRKLFVFCVLALQALCFSCDTVPFGTGMEKIADIGLQEERFILPVQTGKIINGYGWQRDFIIGDLYYHRGIDFGAPIGTPVMATKKGTVMMTGYSRHSGNYIIIEHNIEYGDDDYIVSFYAHLSIVDVKQGDTVMRGSKIGEVGISGYSTGPHLHWGVFKNRQTIDPLTLIN